MAKILIVEGDKVTPLDETKFTLEEKLQDYLEQYPSLIPLGEVVEGASDLLCIGKEVGVASGSLDLLFIDRDGILTVVETKLAKNPEARRTVVGQILEYASYIYEWTADDVYKIANDYLEKDLDEAIKRPIDEDFRAKIEQNLRSGKIRLLIAVDELVEPLRATVTFLTENSNFEILLLQVKSFEESETRKVLIPTLFGYSRPMTGAGRHRWTEGEFLEAASKNYDDQELETIRKLLEFTKNHADGTWWGTGEVWGSFSFHKLNKEGQRVSVFSAYSSGGIWLNFGYMKDKVDKEVLESFRAELNKIPGVGISEEAVTGNRFPSMKAKVLADPANLERFQEAVLSLCQVIEAGN